MRARQNKEGDWRNSERFKNRHKPLDLAKGSDSSTSRSSLMEPLGWLCQGTRGQAPVQLSTSITASSFLTLSSCISTENEMRPSTGEYSS